MAHLLKVTAISLGAIFLASHAQAAHHRMPASADTYMAVSPYGEVPTRDTRITTPADAPPVVSTGGPVGGLPDKN